MCAVISDNSQGQQRYLSDNGCPHPEMHHENYTLKEEIPLYRLLTYNVSDDFKTFGATHEYLWFGYNNLLREILSEISYSHHGIREKIHNLDFCYEYEHSLILPEGINIPCNTPIGKVPSIHTNGKYYLVGSITCQPWNHDIIVQYSIPNIKNLKISKIYHPSLIQKMIYIRPLSIITIHAIKKGTKHLSRHFTTCIHKEDKSLCVTFGSMRF
jgi:hypothetical protein